MLCLLPSLINSAPCARGCLISCVRFIDACFSLRRPERRSVEERKYHAKGRKAEVDTLPGVVNGQFGAFRPERRAPARLLAEAPPGVAQPAMGRAERAAHHPAGFLAFVVGHFSTATCAFTSRLSQPRTPQSCAGPSQDRTWDCLSAEMRRRCLAHHDGDEDMLPDRETPLCCPSAAPAPR